MVLRKDALSAGNSDGRRFASSSAIYLLANVLNAVVPFALLPILTRYLNPAEYGQVAMFQTLVAAFAAITGVNTLGAANRKYYDEGVTHTELAYFITACLQILLVSTLATLAIVYIFKDNLSTWFGIYPGWVLWAVVVSAAGFVSTLRLGQWQVRDHAIRYGALQVSQGVAGMLLSLMLVVGMAQGAAGRVHAQIWVMSFFAFIALVFFYKDGLIHLRSSWRPDHWREALRFGIPLIPHVGGMFLLSVADRLVINDSLGLSQVGLYMVAAQIALIVPVILDAVNKAYLPWVYERLHRNNVGEMRQVVRATYWLFGLLLIGSILTFLIGPRVVLIAAGEQYKEAGQVLGWLVLGHAFGGVSAIFSHYVFYSKRTGMLSIVTIVSGLLNVGLLLLLVGPLGINGAAIAFAVSMGIRSLLTWWIAQRQCPMPWFA